MPALRTAGAPDRVIDPAGRRVLHVSRVGFVGGAERVMLTLTAGLGSYGYEPAIACPGGGTLEQAAARKGVAVLPVPFDRMRITRDPRTLLTYPRALLEGGRTLQRIARETRVRLIHVHHPVGALYARRAARSLGVPLVVHLHDGPPASFLYRRLLKQASRDASLVLCVSEAAKSVLDDAGGDLGKAEILPNPVDPSFLMDGVQPARDVVGAGPHVGIFGVIEPRKGHDVFVEAVARLASRYPTATFWIVGPAPFDDKLPFLARIRDLVAHHGLGGRVVFTGHREDVPALMKAMSVVVSASVSHESFGMVLAEAMALGRPVVTTDVGGTTEVVTDGKTGRVVPIRDPKSLAAAIASILDAETRDLGAAGAADVRARFAPAILLRQVAGLYDRVLSDHAA